MKIVSSEKMAAIDRAAQTDFGIPGLILMENAGIRAIDRWLTKYHGGQWPSGKMVFLAGGGNNGGDALVMARSAWIGGKRDIRIFLVSAAPNEQVELHAGICRALGMDIRQWDYDSEEFHETIVSASVIFDGIAGTGLSGPLREGYDDLVGLLSAARGEIVAIDVPSGIGDRFREGFPVISADITLTMGLPKTALYLPRARKHCGKIEVISIGFPEKLTEDPAIPGNRVEREDFPGILPAIPGDAYKNVRGHAAVFAGNAGTAGAALLSAEGAGRAGAGLVTLFVDSEIYGSLAAAVPPIMVRPLGEELPRDSARGIDAVCVGPGWGTEGRDALFPLILERFPGGVIDADGIRLLSELPEPIDLGVKWVLTPHPGEMSILSGREKGEILDDPIDIMISECRKWNACVLLKGAVTFIGIPDGRYWVVDGMNPALGTGGAGDVLAGIITGLMAGGMEPHIAATAGAAIHAEAGERAAAENGWFLSNELLPHVSRLAFDVRQNVRQK